MVVHSLTKLINGHSDVVGGMIVTKTEALFKRLRKVLSLFGGTMDPHQAWLILRGVRTLSLRAEKGQENAMRLAEFLKHHPKVLWIGILAFLSTRSMRLLEADGRVWDHDLLWCEGWLGGWKKVMNHVRLITLAVSLGGIESLIEHPASMTHASVPKEEREQADILDELVRLSVGCEDFEDLRKDLDQALNRIP